MSCVICFGLDAAALLQKLHVVFVAAFVEVFVTCVLVKYYQISSFFLPTLRVDDIDDDI
jgi:hypothetical protein